MNNLISIKVIELSEIFPHKKMSGPDGFTG